RTPCLSSHDRILPRWPLVIPGQKAREPEPIGKGCLFKKTLAWDHHLHFPRFSIFRESVLRFPSGSIPQTRIANGRLMKEIIMSPCIIGYELKESHLTIFGFTANIQPYFVTIVMNHFYVTIKVAQSLDGSLAFSER